METDSKLNKETDLRKLARLMYFRIYGNMVNLENIVKLEIIMKLPKAFKCYAHTHNIIILDSIDINIKFLGKKKLNFKVQMALILALKKAKYR